MQCSYPKYMSNAQLHLGLSAYFLLWWPLIVAAVATVPPQPLSVQIAAQGFLLFHLVTSQALLAFMKLILEVKVVSLSHEIVLLDSPSPSHCSCTVLCTSRSSQLSVDSRQLDFLGKHGFNVNFICLSEGPPLCQKHLSLKDGPKSAILWFPFCLCIQNQSVRNRLEFL